MIASILGWVAIGLLCVPFILVLVLSVPVVATVRARTGPQAGFAAELRLVSESWPALGRFDSRDEQGPRSADRKTTVEDTAPKKSKRRRFWRSGPSRRLVRRMILAAPALVRETLGVFTVSRLQLRARIGLGDPADTGQLFGLVFPVIHATRLNRWDIDVEPAFDQAVLDGRADVCIRLVPIRLAVPAARFGWRVLRPAQ